MGIPAPPMGIPAPPAGAPYPVPAGTPYPVAGTPYPPTAAYPATAPYPPYPAGPVPPPTPPRRRRTKLISLVAIGLAVALLAGCLGVARLVFSDDDNPGTAPAAGASGSAAPGAASGGEPISPEGYQVALTAVDTELTTTLRQLGAAKTPATVQKAAGDLVRAAEQGSGRLNQLTPPEPVADAHQELITALDDLASAASEAESAAGEKELCAGSAATALVSRDEALDAIRAAAQTLATADPAHAYKVGAALPKEAKDTNRRMKNGAYIKRTRGGSGHLKITNGGQVDSVISVVKTGGKKSAITVYVRGKGKHTVTGVKDGTYRVYMASGADWDAKAKRFTRNCGFSQFDETFKFTTTSTRYTIWEITMTPTDGGNASTSGVDPEDFPS